MTLSNTPIFTFSSDNNTGIYYPGSNNITFSSIKWKNPLYVFHYPSFIMNGLNDYDIKLLSKLEPIINGDIKQTFGFVRFDLYCNEYKFQKSPVLYNNSEIFNRLYNIIIKDPIKSENFENDIEQILKFNNSNDLNNFILYTQMSNQLTFSLKIKYLTHL